MIDVCLEVSTHRVTKHERRPRPGRPERRGQCLRASGSGGSYFAKAAQKLGEQCWIRHDIPGGFGPEVGNTGDFHQDAVRVWIEKARYKCVILRELFYGIQTLRALIPPEYDRSPHAKVPVDATSIEDAPRFHYRGLTLDVARNFQSKQAILKLLDAMAFYKLNKLQLHLADDEGWRLEIAGLPELTQVGGRRGHTLRETDHLVPSFGSGVSANPAISHGSGYYSRADFLDILRHAKLRHIEVIPEIESPGHARAAIIAMRARFFRLTKQGRTEDAKAYLLSDPEDQSSYQSVQRWHDNVMNVCIAFNSPLHAGGVSRARLNLCPGPNAAKNRAYWRRRSARWSMDTVPGVWVYVCKRLGLWEVCR